MNNDNIEIVVNTTEQTEHNKTNKGLTASLSNNINADSNGSAKNFKKNIVTLLIKK